ILNQMVNVVNSVIDEYGTPDEVRIELARELKKSAKEREDDVKMIAQATKANEDIKKIIQSEFNIQHVSKNDIIRYKLYKELEPRGYKTLYSNTYIPKEDIFSNKFDIEHIIPQARLFDDSFSNKTLEARDINIEKGSSTAYDYILNKWGNDAIEQYEYSIKELLEKGYITRAKYNKLKLKGEEIGEGFIERELRDSQYIAKKSKELLESIVRRVISTTGSITKRLREDWQLIDVMQELNWDKYNKLGLTQVIEGRDGKRIKRIKDWTKRNDHRHHAMDALTIAFTKESYIQYLNNLNARSDKGSSIYAIQQKELERDANNKLVFKLPVQNFRSEAKKHLESVIVSIKAKNKVTTSNYNITKAGYGNKNRALQLTPRGQLHLETVYAKKRRYATRYEKVNALFTQERIMMVANKKERLALLSRLKEYSFDPKKAFTGKNTLEKNPIYIDSAKTISIPSKVKMVDYENTYTIRKDISPDLNIDKVVDARIRKILQDRLDMFEGDPRKAFSNLDINPIWLNKEKGVSIKRVSIFGISNAIALHTKRDHNGNIILDCNGAAIESDFVNTGNNHHVAIYRDMDGNLQESIVSFYEATKRASNGMPVVDREYNKELGWEFLFTMKQNECFVFPNADTGFNPKEIDLKDSANYSIISPNLYRVQKLASKDYNFRHHLETGIEDRKELQNITWKRIRSLNQMDGLIKVRINHIGKIVDVGE
ncbi:MAG: type II CRISPR RNA-guided endonuclease Cas9, partial [Bacteroidales bacterium]|nr:type II CRISPR RNA-guided endonuclease Cas9 [Bacteroidales bacterium]